MTRRSRCGRHPGTTAGFADVIRPLDEPLPTAVRVDDVHLRVAERRIEAPERDLAVRAGRPRTRRKRSNSGERDGKQHKETDSSANEKPHIASSSPWG